MLLTSLICIKNFQRFFCSSFFFRTTRLYLVPKLETNGAILPLLHNSSLSKLKKSFAFLTLYVVASVNGNIDKQFST